MTWYEYLFALAKANFLIRINKGTVTAKFWEGYKTGVHRSWCWRICGTEEDHIRRLTMWESWIPAECAFGRGYQAGLISGLETKNVV